MLMANFFEATGIKAFGEEHDFHLKYMGSYVCNPSYPPPKNAPTVLYELIITK